MSNTTEGRCLNRKNAIKLLIAILITALAVGATIIYITTPGPIYNPLQPTEPHMHP